MNPRSLLQLATLAANNADQHPRGLGWLGGTGDYVQAGTVVQWVGKFYQSDGTNVEQVYRGIAGRVANDLAAMLYTGGWFSDVQVDWNGVFGIDFLVQVTAGTDFAHLSDIASAIEGVAWNLGGYDQGYPHLAPQRIALNVLSVPRSNRPASVQPTPSPTGGGGTGSNGGSGNNSGGANVPPPKCPYPTSLMCDCGQEWSWSHLGCAPIGSSASGNIFDSLASWLGVTPTQAVIVGALGAVLAVVAIKRVL